LYGVGALALAASAVCLSWRHWTFRECPAWLAVQREALFRIPQEWRGRPRTSRQTSPFVFFLLYRKTGVELTVRLCYALSDSVCERFQGAFKGPWFQNSSNVEFGKREGWLGHHLGVVLSPAWERPISPAMSGHKYALVIVPARSWPLPRHARAVHWVRDPVSLILSGYRYAASHSLEPWQSWRSQCWSCDEQANRAVFGTCDHRCSYNDLLQHVDEPTGVLIEAVLDRSMLQHMLGNLQRWARHPNVLHLSVSHLQLDYVRSMRCMLRFLGFADDRLMNRLTKLRYDTASLCGSDDGLALKGLCEWIYQNEHTHNDRHVTRGVHNNTDLEMLLTKHPFWAEGFHSARTALSEVFKRQEDLYDCPAGVLW